MKKLFTLAATAALAVVMAPAALAQTWNVILTPQQETPPINTTGFGTGTVSYNEALNQLTYLVNFQLQGNYLFSHIHRAPAGTAGPVVFDLFQTSPGVLSGTINNLTPTQVNDLRAGLYYINIHSDIARPGEIRGQIVPEPGTIAALSLGLAGLARLRRRK